MTPEAQMSIASITKTVVAAQVMRLVESGDLALDDLAADLLPPGLDFDTNGATIEHLLSMRSGLPETIDDEAEWALLSSDPLHEWTPEEVLATVAATRTPVGGTWEYRGANYMLLGLVIEHVTGRPLAEVLRRGVLAGDGYDRLISQPGERPTRPLAMPFGVSDERFDDVGGFLPGLASVTGLEFEGGMASDSASLARWFTALCAGQVVTQTSLDQMTDFVARPGYGFGLIDRSTDYPGRRSLGHTGNLNGYVTVALCFPDARAVVTVLVNEKEHDVDTLAGALVAEVRP
jgi:D-alanyl-D-alanine carboxypeptidase